MSELRQHMPQLDGWRAVAMMGVIYHHWLPASWRYHVPTEAGLFLFFLLSGFLMTSGLLREVGSESKAKILRRFHRKRFFRIYPAYYAALILAALLGVKEVLQNPWGWLLNIQNFLIVQWGYWPPGVSHFWTLAVEQQYYLFWPLLVLAVPRKLLPWVLILLAMSAPLARAFTSNTAGWAVDLLPWGVIDQFALGGCLACWMTGQGKFPQRWMDLAGVLALVGYLGLYLHWEWDRPLAIWCHAQQTLLAIVLMALVARAVRGNSGFLSRWLEHPWLVQLGQRSYGIYLFHNLAPLVVGKVAWFLWDDRLPSTLAIWLRLPFFIVVTWLLSMACHRWVESKIRDGRTNIG